MNIEAQILEQRHIDALAPRLQAGQAGQMRSLIENRGYASLMRAAGPCAAFLIDGQVAACAGLIDYPGTGRCVIWALYAGDMRRFFSVLYRKMLLTLKFYPRRRYEAYIDPTWRNARRLASTLGFTCEGLMKSFEPDGSDRELWALIQPEVK